MLQRRVKISVVVTMLLVSGCASVSISNFQDGKSLGKNKIRVGTGIEMSPMINYGLGGADKEHPEKFKEVDSTLYFWSLATLFLQIGITDNIDIGFIPFSDFSSIYSAGAISNSGAKAFVKYAMMDEKNKVQVAFVPYIGFGRFKAEDSNPSKLESEWDSDLIQYNTSYYGLDIPISIQDVYLTLKVYSDDVKGNFTYFDKPDIEHTPSLGLRTSYGFALGGNVPALFEQAGALLSKNKPKFESARAIELQVMYQKSHRDEFSPRVYIGYTKFFTFGGSD
tara:strand:- start:342 stop:1181 length:840 start_codon:yes stop_codon:yes gene_type:complete